MNQAIAKAQIPAALQGVIRTELFIDGKFVAAESGETMATLNPHDNSEIAQIAMAGKADIDKAVAAAQRAFPKWSRMAAMDRGRILLKLADLIEANAEQLAMLESLDLKGEPFRDEKKLGPGKKSFVVTLTLRSRERTLTNTEADDLRTRIVEACAKSFGR